MSTQTPRKLKKDAIVEAICELRFTSSDLPALVIGRLGDYDFFENSEKKSLPASQIPPEIRSTEESLRYQAVLEIMSIKGTHSVRVGPNSLSYHVSAPYCGWEKLYPRIGDLCTALFEKTNDLRVERVGLRYINSLNESDHKISSAIDLTANVEIAGEQLTVPITLAYSIDNDETTRSLVRVASPFFAKGNVPSDASCIVDIDVATQVPADISNKDEALDWIKRAHSYEKGEFFKLIPKTILSELVEDWQ